MSSKELKKAKFVQGDIGFKNLAEYGIILESYPILEEVLKLDYPFEIIHSYHLDYDWYLLNIAKTKIVFAVTQGAPMAVDLAERFIASGVKKVVRIGTIGSLSDTLRLGDILVPYAAIKDEGTSSFYLKKESPAIADIDFVQAITNQLRKAKHTVHNGIVWSTDGRWKENDESIKSRISDGAIATDMESSALFAFGIDRKTSVASLSILSDEIHNSEGEFKGLSDKDIWFKLVLPHAVDVFDNLIKLFSQKK